MSTSNEPVQPQVATKSGQAAERSFGRAANWTVGIAAAVLVLISVGGYFYHREQLSAIAADHLRLIVTGPSSVLAGAGAEYMVSTTAISGQPLPAQIEVAILGPDGQRLKAYKEPADEHGRLRVAIPSDLQLPSRVTLKVTALHRDSQETAELPLEVEPVRYATQLTLDRASYRPGDTVLYRSTTLERLALKAGREMPVRFEILAPDGSVASGSSGDATMQRGIASGQFLIPESAPTGQYVLVAGSPDGIFTSQRRTFLVASQPPSPESKKDAKTPDKAKSDAAKPDSTKPDPASNKTDADSNKPDAASVEPEVVLSAGAGVFAAGKPLEFNIRSAHAGVALVVAAFCDGVQVGQQPLVTSAGGNAVAIPLDASIGGPIRLMLFDYRTSPPKTIAEQSIHRQRAQNLTVRVDGVKQRYSPGDNVDLSLLVTNEKKEPVPAALSVCVADAANSATDRNGSVVGLPNPAGNGELTSALTPDLLLGAQPMPAETLNPPLMFDNLGEIRSNYEKCLANYQADRTKALNTLTTASFFCGLGLVLLVAMLGLMGIVSGMHLWIPAVGATTCCLIMGAILMDPGRLATSQDLGVPFAPYLGPFKTDVKGENRPTSDGTRSMGDQARGDAGKSTQKTSAPGPTIKTPYWNPLLIAGPDGKATIRFKLPDVSSTFRLTVDAHDEGRVGTVETAIVSRKADAKPQAKGLPK
jgi:hypothetical protein